jgi:hypothetical protein
MKYPLFYFRKTFFIFFLCMFCISCSQNKDKVPSGIIPPEKMAEILTDVHIAEAYTNYKNLQADALKQSISDYYHFIFKTYGISDADFEESFDYYSKNPVAFIKVYDQVLIHLSKKEAENVARK